MGATRLRGKNSTAGNFSKCEELQCEGAEKKPRVAGGEQQQKGFGCRTRGLPLCAVPLLDALPGGLASPLSRTQPCNAVGVKAEARKGLSCPFAHLGHRMPASCSPACLLVVSLPFASPSAPMLQAIAPQWQWVLA